MNRKSVNTGGGVYIGGNVDTSGGDFVGRDQTKTIRLSSSEITELFKPVYTAIDSRSDIPPEDRADIKAEVDEIQAEVTKGEQAEENFMMRRLRNLKRMAPDIFEVVLATLANPVAGMSTVVSKIKLKMKESLEEQ